MPVYYENGRTAHIYKEGNRYCVEMVKNGVVIYNMYAWSIEGASTLKTRWLSGEIPW